MGIWGETVIWGGGEGGLGGGGKGDLGDLGIWLVETVMWRVVGRGMWGVGIFAYFIKHEELWERVEGESVLQGNPEVVERGIWWVGIFAYFAKQGELWERVEGVLQGNPHIVVCPSFSLDL